MPNYEKNSQKSNFVDISSNKQVKKLYNKKGRLKRILCLVFSMIFLLGGGGMLYYYSFLDTLNFKELDDTNNNTAATNSSVAPLESDATNLSLSEGELLQNSKELNVMLFGEDNSKGDKHGRSDTMIMMTIDNNHKKLKLTSFQRDTYVYIPGYGYDKLNASYNYGGAKLSIQTIEANFGIKVDRYAVVDFDSFKKIIDTLGGIDMEVTQDEIDYINYQMYKNNQADTRTTITDAPGTVHLNGQEALWYARNRGLTKGEDGNEIGLDGDDWDRTSRQRKLLETLFTSMKSADLGHNLYVCVQVFPENRCIVKGLFPLNPFKPSPKQKRSDDVLWQNERFDRRNAASVSGMQCFVMSKKQPCTPATHKKKHWNEVSCCYSGRTVGN